MSSFGDYFTIKTNVKEPNVEVFVSFKIDKLYRYIKTNQWKRHKYDISTTFKGYSDAHMAMKFVVNIIESKDFPEKLKSVLDSAISIYELSNISYDDYKNVQQKREQDNYELFMRGLRGEKI